MEARNSQVEALYQKWKVSGSNPDEEIECFKFTQSFRGFPWGLLLTDMSTR
jgi:hypothetical protein